MELQEQIAAHANRPDEDINTGNLALLIQPAKVDKRVAQPDEEEQHLEDQNETRQNHKSLSKKRSLNRGQCYHVTLNRFLKPAIALDVSTLATGRNGKQ